LVTLVNHILPRVSSTAWGFLFIMKYIELSKQGKNRGLYRAIVDDEDFEALNKYNWFVKVKNHTVYARRSFRENGITKHISMHNQILHVDHEKITDHINHNGLDNRRCNLRKCTTSENNINRTKKPNATSKYIGVHLKRSHNRTYIKSTINVFGKQINLGTFNTEIEAAKAYDEAAKIHHGDFANLNFKQ